MVDCSDMHCGSGYLCGDGFLQHRDLFQPPDGRIRVKPDPSERHRDGLLGFHRPVRSPGRKVSRSQRGNIHNVHGGDRFEPLPGSPLLHPFPYLFLFHLCPYGGFTFGPCQYSLRIPHLQVVQEKRGTAIGIATAGIGLGGVIIAPISNILISHFGWRGAYFVLGVGVLGIMLPLLLFVREDPASMDLVPDGKAIKESSGPRPPETEWTASEALKTPIFWMASMDIFFAYGTLFGTLSHQVPFIRDMGIPADRAAALFSVTAGMGALGKFVFGSLMDRLPPRSVVSSCFILQAAGVLILLFTRSIEMLWIFVIVFGFAMGGTASLRPPL